MVSSRSSSNSLAPTSNTSTPATDTSIPTTARRNSATLHPRNKHQGRYDFDALSANTPELKAFVSLNTYGDQSINFADPNAVKALNLALLRQFYAIEHWDIPANYLCPPIPGRADYVHYLADLLGSSNQGAIPNGAKVRVLDVGVGANVIYPLLGHAEYGWQFVGSDVDTKALASAQRILDTNQGLSTAIHLRHQTSATNIFKGVLTANDYFDATLCNPPFHRSPEEALQGTQRKWRGLNRANSKQGSATLNFGGQHNELWCDGGEVGFIRRMIDESRTVSQQVFWFSSLVSKASNLPSVLQALRRAKAVEVKTIDMTQGQKQSRFVAWTFLNAAAQAQWRKQR